mmetsp:Transcript_22291/g.46973  ORF Transcript_22291/g.46973 Transcript_22291/m.46973 type:complete len:375 (+) Transcript_22291:52-1176(+)
MMQQLLLSCLVLSLTISTTAFSPNHALVAPQGSLRELCGESTSLCMAVKRKKKKPSMAERRKRRHSKSLGGPNPYEGLPSPKLDFSSGEGEKEAAADPIKVANPEAAAEKAKELLKAQRDSVNMLTMVKECLTERLSDSEVRSSLENNGFAIVDDFFGRCEDKSEEAASVLAQLKEEGTRMLEEGGMEVDTTNIGKGQYIVPIAGGEEQYTTCPRMVEIVVSSTKNVPEVFGESDDEDSKHAVLELDDAASMATLRTFDRKALKASLALLMGNDDDDALEKSEEATPLAVIADKDDDKRKLSLHYYIVPDTWNENCGGGLEFEGGEKVYAKKDRLVIFRSDATKCKAIAWKGSDESPELMTGNTMELHLIEKRQ